MALLFEMCNIKISRYLLYNNTHRTLKIFSNCAQEHAIQTENYKRQNEFSAYSDLSVCSSWNSDNVEIKTIRNDLLRDMQVLPNFINETEEDALYSEISLYLKKMRYEFDHWDNAIHGYRETERTEWKGLAGEVLKRAKEKAFPPSDVPLPHTHVLDLDEKGYIKPHVDAVRFCGMTVSGICLLSPAVMRLRHSSQNDLFADFLLPRRCLYIMTGTARYDFSHEVLENKLSVFKNEQVTRTRRISIISRSQPRP